MLGNPSVSANRLPKIYTPATKVLAPDTLILMAIDELEMLGERGRKSCFWIIQKGWTHPGARSSLRKHLRKLQIDGFISSEKTDVFTPKGRRKLLSDIANLVELFGFESEKDQSARESSGKSEAESLLLMDKVAAPEALVVEARSQKIFRPDKILEWTWGKRHPLTRDSIRRASFSLRTISDFEYAGARNRAFLAQVIDIPVLEKDAMLITAKENRKVA